MVTLPNNPGRNIPIALEKLLPLVAVLIRFPLIMLGNLILWIALRAAGDPAPWQNALIWSNVHVVLIADTLSLGFLIWVLRREGASLRSLFGFEQTRWLRDLLLGLLMCAILAIALFAGNAIAALLVLGPDAFTMSEMPAIDPATLPPLWYYLWGLLVLPVSVGIVEEMLYRGYAQPRLEALLGKRWLAVLVMALGFGVQHIAFSLISPQAALIRFIGTFLAGIVFGLLYMKQRRLLPLIIGHWLVNAIFLGLLPLMLYLSVSA